ncbi:MAG: methylated-DNA--[protein]-cysteine S-methyltransferase [Actinomycetota bacterium]
MSRSLAWSELPAGELRRTTVESPIGPLVVAADAWGLRRILFPDQGRAAELPEGEVDPDPDHPTLLAAAQQLGEYFEGARTSFELALHPIGSEFQQLAWRALADIPYGQTITYREQAEAIGRPGATQAVGAANGANPLPIVVPCHRVVGADGSLIGFGGGLETKRQLLDLEQGTQRLF